MKSENGEAMSSSLITIVAIFLAAILMFVFPLAAISEMNDQEALAMVQSYTTEFVNKIASKGKITQEDYDGYIQKLYATGNSYDTKIEVHIADTNPGKKTSTIQIGDTTYYVVYDTQIDQELSTAGVYLLKEGDYVKVSYENTNQTIHQMIMSVLYNVTGNTSYLTGEYSSPIYTTGN